MQTLENLKKFFLGIGTPFLDHILPQFCAVCKTEGAVVCENCISNISFNLIREDSDGLDGLFFCTHYHNRVVQEMIHLCKYEYLEHLGSRIGKIAAYVWLSHPHPEIDVCIPVPLHSKRMAERGFNQAELIAKKFSEVTLIPMNTQCVQRTRATKRQVDLDGEKRKENVAGAFFATSVSDTILIIDDVTTTGNTFSEVAFALKSAGASKVYALAFAKG